MEHILCPICTYCPFCPPGRLGLAILRAVKANQAQNMLQKISALSLPNMCYNIPFLGGWEGGWVCWRAADACKKYKFYFRIQILCVHHLTILRKSANVQFTIECAGRVVKQKNAKFLMFHCCVCLLYFQDRWRGRWSENHIVSNELLKYICFRGLIQIQDHLE